MVALLLLLNFYNIRTLAWITTLLQASNTLYNLLLCRQDVASPGIGSTAFGFEPIQCRSTVWKLVSIAERMVASSLLILTFPILFLASIVIVAISHQSPYRAPARRVRGQDFLGSKAEEMWKGGARSQAIFVHRLSAAEAPLLAPDNKAIRVTSRFAALYRRYSVDELPQLWPVVLGTHGISLVGPRPLTRQELDAYYGPHAPRIIAAKPGLSGLWQISGRSRLNYAQRRRLDLFLLEKWFISLYLRILLTTAPRVLAGKDAW